MRMQINDKFGDGPRAAGPKVGESPQNAAARVRTIELRLLSGKANAMTRNPTHPTSPRSIGPPNSRARSTSSHDHVLILI